MKKCEKTTGWPEGFEAYIRGRSFTDMEELLLWDCSSMHECLQEALNGWLDQSGMDQTSMRAEEWREVRIKADQISMEMYGAPLRMKAIRWGCRLAGQLERAFWRSD